MQYALSYDNKFKEASTYLASTRRTKLRCMMQKENSLPLTDHVIHFFFFNNLMYINIRNFNVRDETFVICISKNKIISRARLIMLGALSLNPSVYLQISIQRHDSILY